VAEFLDRLGKLEQSPLNVSSSASEKEEEEVEKQVHLDQIIQESKQSFVGSVGDSQQKSTQLLDIDSSGTDSPSNASLNLSSASSGNEDENANMIKQQD
jgi:hypothetical protein